MMNISCEIIKDLLPLYYDNVCSKASKHLVEEHLSTCSDCRNELEQLNVEIGIKNSDNDVKVMTSILDKWKKDRLLAFLFGIFLLSTVSSIGCAVAFNVIGSYVTPDGLLVEPFALIPIAFFFGLVAIVSGIALIFTRLIKRSKK